ncbi:MAG: hypothetical protein M3O70_04805 [Actinomycetota bacterium]|nr:hypothetical protein [Actinomycetota bacterium]
MSLEFVWFSATVLTFGTLVVAGHGHLRSTAALSTALRLRYRMGPRSSGAGAKLIGFYELVLGGTGLAAAVAGAAGLLRLVTAAALVTYVVYTWHVWSLHAWGVDAPCGCTSEDAPANRGTVARTLALALATALAFAIGEVRVFSPSLQGPPVVMLLMGALAGATFTSLLWNLPAAVARD